MQIHNFDELAIAHCVPCEAGTPSFPDNAIDEQLKQLLGWSLSLDRKKIQKAWKVKNFISGLAFFQAVAEIAEAEDHHPDLHLEGYRNASIEIWTHTVNGLSQNDFILAAKIDQIDMARFTSRK